MNLLSLLSLDLVFLYSYVLYNTTDIRTVELNPCHVCTGYIEERRGRPEEHPPSPPPLPPLPPHQLHRTVDVIRGVLSLDVPDRVSAHVGGAGCDVSTLESGS